MPAPNTIGADSQLPRGPALAGGGLFDFGEVGARRARRARQSR
jgi:hypothetical protein